MLDEKEEEKVPVPVKKEKEVSKDLLNLEKDMGSNKLIERKQETDAEAEARKA